jgi:hypothetical protein
MDARHAENSRLVNYLGGGVQPVAEQLMVVCEPDATDTIRGVQFFRFPSASATDIRYVPGDTTKVASVGCGIFWPLIEIVAPAGVDVMISRPVRAGVWDGNPAGSSTSQSRAAAKIDAILPARTPVLPIEPMKGKVAEEENAQ